MATTDEQVLQIFRETGALLEGHFILRSGLRSGHFFQCARVCERLDAVEQLAGLLLEKLKAWEFTTVVAPAMGGLVIGQEVARQARARFLFVEKVDGGVLALRRNFKIEPGERILVVEDVITRGGRLLETVDIVRQEGGHVVGAAVLVDRSAGQAALPIEVAALLEMNFPTYEPDQLPEHLAALPAIKPGS